MPTHRHTSRDDALTIWQAGVDSVRSQLLVRRELEVIGQQLRVAERTWTSAQIGTLQVVGAGTAGAGMPAGVDAALAGNCFESRMQGWINVPANCVRPLQHITLHAARPAEYNEPTEAGVVGAMEILRRVAALQTNDLCIALISGGGSALLPAPRTGLTLDDLLTVTRIMSAAGADIRELNGVRRQLSAIQGGGLARECRAQDLITLVISDVLGDPLELIASGPTVPIAAPRQAAEEALRLFDRFQLTQHGVRPQVRALLVSDIARWQLATDEISTDVPHTWHKIIGNNDVATSAAAQTARQLGYETHVLSVDQSSPRAESVGRDLVTALFQRHADARAKRPWCLISGGEPVVE